MSPKPRTPRQLVSLAKATEKSRQVRALRVKQTSPRDVLISHLDKRSWDARKLADRLSQGDDDKARYRTRGVIAFYLDHPTGDIDIGSILCSRLDEAFALPRDSFRRLERQWADERKGRGVQ